MDGIKLDREAIDIKGGNKAVGAGLAAVAGMVGALAGSPIAGISALGAVFTAIGEVDAKDKPGRLAFILIAGALVRTLEATLAESKLVFTPVASEFKQLQTGMMEDLQSGDIVLTEEIFTEPMSFSYLETFEKRVLDTLGRLFEAKDKPNVGMRLRHNFTGALHRTWSVNADAFESLQLALNTPFSDALKFEIEQQRYLNFIQIQFSDEKLIGQTDDDPVLLSQVFVPLRGYWERPVEPQADETGANRTSKTEDVKSERVLLDFSSEILSWIEAQASVPVQQADPIRIVSGGPGIGKSSSLKAVAAELARSGKCFPVFVPLQRIVGEGEPLERIGKELKAVDACSLSENPIGDKTDKYCANGPVVLFLDGLDEIVAAGSDGAAVTREFVRDVRSMIYNKNVMQQKARVIAVISGRIPAARKAIEQLGLKQQQILHLMPFLVDEEDRELFAEETSSELLRQDQRALWWSKWHSRRPADPVEVPDVLVSHQFHDVSIEPLLFYFLVLVRAWEPKDGEQGINRNAVYKRVLEEFHSRELKKEDARGMADKFKDFKNQFEIILQAMAMAAWRGGTSRVGKLKDVELFLKDWDPPLFDEFDKALGQGDRAFGASLFFHTRESEGHNTFEFLHKSFTEYLVARRFRASLTRLAKRYQLRQDSGVTEAELLKNWVWTWGSRNIDSDVFAFIEGEYLEKDAGVDMTSTAHLFRIGLKQGYPAHSLTGDANTFDDPPKTFSAMTDWARNAEEALLVGVHTANWAFSAGDNETQHQTIDLRGGYWEGSYFLVIGNMLARLLLQRDQGFVTHKCLAGLNLDLSHLSWADLREADLRNASLRRAFLAGAFLGRANLSGADLEGAFLGRANLSGAFLGRANLSGADLEGAFLGRANLTGANLREADLSGADLSGAGLSGADLRGADLSGVNFSRTDLSGTDLSDSDSVAAVHGLRQSGGLGEADLPQGWSAKWNEDDKAWDITMPDGALYVDPRERK